MISVLYVDDESALLEVAKTFMEHSGEFQVDTATSAREAIGKLKAHPYDAVVSDYLMPEMDGIELLRYLRPRCNGMPFIIFTGKGDENTAIEALNSGADYYLRKGSSPKCQFLELETRIRSAVARRQSERELRRSERKYRGIIETLTDTVFSTNAEGIVSYMSPGIRRFGYEPKDLTGKDFAVIVSAEDIPPVARHFEELIRETQVPFEFRVTDRSGRTRWVRCSCKPVLINGRFAGVEGLIAEITEHRDEDERVRLRERQFRELVETGTDGMLILDPSSGFPLAFNDEACRQLEYSREEFARTSVQEWMGNDAPAAIRAWITTIKKEGSLSCSARHRTKTGEMRSVKISARLIDSDEKNGLCLCIRDTTEAEQAERSLRKSEAALRDIYDQAPAAYAVLSPEGKILDVNRSFLALSGYSTTELAGKGLEELVDPARARDFGGVLHDAAQTETIRTVMYPFIRKDGARSVVSMEISAGYEGDKSGRRIYCVLTDITESAEESGKIREAAAASRAILFGAGEAIFSCGPDGTIATWNAAMESLSGLRISDALGKPLDEVLPFFAGELKTVRDDAFAGKTVGTGDFRYVYPVSGKTGWARVIFSPEKSRGGELPGIIGIMQEVSERREAEQRARAANRIYSMIARVSTTGPKTRNLEVFLNDLCTNAVAGSSLRIAWIGLYDPFGDVLRPVAHEGPMETLPPKEGIAVSELEGGGWPAGKALRTGRPEIGSAAEDTEADGGSSTWQSLAFRQGCRSAVAVPFRLHGAVVGVLCMGSDDPESFTAAEIEPLLALGAAISSILDVLDRQALQRKTGKGGKGSWERTRFLAEALESSTVPFIIAYADTTVGAVNTSACALFGYTEDEIIRLHWGDLFRERDPDAARDRVSEVISTGVPGRFAAECERKDGSLVPVEIALQKMIDETSGLPCVSAGICDISAFHNRAGDLEKLAGRFRTFFTGGCVGMLIARRDGTLCEVNPEACSLFGRSEPELLACVLRDLLGQDPRFVGLMKDYLENSKAQGVIRLSSVDGTLFDAEVSFSPCIDDLGNEALGIVLIDVTRQRRAEAEHARVRDIPASILENLPIAVRLTGPDGSLEYFNSAWRNLTGTGESDADDAWMEKIHPDDRERYRAARTDCEKSPSLSVTEFRFMGSSGQYRWIRETATPGVGPGGASGGFTFSYTDREEIRNALEDLAGIKAYFRALFENATHAILVMDDAITGCNAAVSELTGTDKVEIVGRQIESFAPEKQPDGRFSTDAMREYLAEARSGRSLHFAWQLERKDGTPRETMASIYPMGISDKNRVIVILHDVTEERRAEREIRHLAAFPEMDASPIIEVTRDKKIVYTNPAASHALKKLGMPQDPLAFLPLDFDILAGSMPGQGRREVCCMVQIKEAYFHEWICPSPDPATLVVYAHDITDRVQASDALAYANHKLGILTSITRHDIKNKLTGVTGYLSLLRNSVKDPQMAAYLDRAEAAAMAIRNHIDFTKDYETLGGTAPVWQPLAPLIGNIRTNLDTGKTEIEYTAGGITIYADPMLSKVFYNIIENSLRHGVHVRHIRISVSRIPDNGCLIVYEDDGIGVPEDKKEMIFERGFTTSPLQNSSSGLGLFLVRDILSITGITIRENGTPGEGVRFEMTVPPGKWKENVNE
ncbi:MAG: PAS domain S-box protein [Methanoregula sp.]|jgi:PAS domain S-box-containing protein